MSVTMSLALGTASHLPPDESGQSSELRACGLLSSLVDTCLTTWSWLPCLALHCTHLLSYVQCMAVYVTVFNICKRHS